MGTYKSLPEGRKKEILACVALGHDIGFDVSAGEAEEIAGDFIWRLGRLAGVSIRCDLEAAKIYGGTFGGNRKTHMEGMGLRLPEGMGAGSHEAPLMDTSADSSKYRGVTKEAKERIKKLYKEGMTKSAIARELGVNRKTVIKYTSE